MNCSESQRLRTLLSRLLLELHHRGNASRLGAEPGPSMGMGVVPDPFVGREVTSARGDDAYLYILLIMVFYACLAGGSWPTLAPASLSRPRTSRPRPAPSTSGPREAPRPKPRQPPAPRQTAAASSPSGGCLHSLRAPRGSRAADPAHLAYPWARLLPFPPLPGFASPEAQAMMRGQETLPGRRSAT
uniref:Uncharacterized protein n=1 Tax=Loxodonta africana TaxID=9785 RepID=G3U476_LOXAF